MQDGIECGRGVVHVHVRASRHAVAVDGDSGPTLREHDEIGDGLPGYWWGPYTLLPRVMMYGRLYERPQAMTSISAPALVAEYGLVGSNRDAASTLASSFS